MRLSEVLNRAPDSSQAQVEGFLGSQRLGWGRHKNIEIGRVIRNYFCRPCDDTRTFFSGDRLSCLVTGSHSVSIDVTLRCSACQSPMEAWFLVGCADDLFGQAPIVHLERFTENKRDVATAVGAQAGEIHELFERAQIAFEDHLGAGSMVYLRKAFEIVTSQAAAATGIPTKHSAAGGRHSRPCWRKWMSRVTSSPQSSPTTGTHSSVSSARSSMGTLTRPRR